MDSITIVGAEDEEEADPVQAEISADEQGTSTEFNFEEDRTLVEKLFNVDTCGSTGTKLSAGFTTSHTRWI
jgi:hypothetical protein